MIGQRSRCCMHWLISSVDREDMRERRGSHVYQSAKAMSGDAAGVLAVVGRGHVVTSLCIPAPLGAICGAGPRAERAGRSHSAAGKRAAGKRAAGAPPRAGAQAAAPGGEPRASARGPPGSAQPNPTEQQNLFCSVSGKLNKTHFLLQSEHQSRRAALAADRPAGAPRRGAV